MSDEKRSLENRIRVGTCGWSYKDDWRKVFYPEWLAEKDFLEFYAATFSTNEIDSSFYNTPRPEFVQSWINKTPPNFLFSAKIPQEVTHKAKLNLKLATKSLQQHCLSFSSMERTGKLLAHLVQLPPQFTADKDGIQLENFLNYWAEWRETEGKGLLVERYNPRSWKLVIEFRHLSWMNEKTFELLRKYNTTYCAVIEPILPPRMDITSNELFYLRFHGFGQNPWFNYLFSQKEIEHWASELKTIIRSNPKTTFAIYFNNHFSGNAVKNARDIIPQLDLPSTPDLESVSQLFKSNTKPKKETNHKIQSLDSWMKK